MVLCCRSASTTEDAGDAGVKNGLVPSSKRKCRDVFCCLLFLVYWVGMIVVAVIGLQTGRPLSLVYGRDYNGSVCGDGAMSALPLTTYPRLDEDMLVALTHDVALTEMPFFGVCVAACPRAGETVCTYDNASCWTAALDTSPVLFRCLPLDAQNETIVSETCIDPADADPSCTLERFVSGACARVCKTKRVQKNVWQVGATTPNPLLEQLQGHLQTLGRLVGDTRAAAGLILAVGGGGAMALGVLWLVLLQFFAGCMVWLTCALVLLALVAMSLFCSVRSGLVTSSHLNALVFVNGTASSTDTSTESSVGIDASSLQSAGDASTRLQFEAAAYVLWVLTALIFLLLVAMRKRIHIAIAILRESSRAIKQLPLLLLWPVLPTLLFVALVVYSVAIAAYIMSSGDLSDVVQSTAALAANATVSLNNATSDLSDDLSALPSDTIQQALLAFHLFGFLWTNQLIQAVSITTIAGAVAQFYWTAPDAHGRRKLEARFPIVRALKYVVRFSLGSLCFGSFVIALVQFLRIVLEYIDRQTQELQQSNRVVKVAFLAVRCCLWCFEKCLKFLSKNAYILIAMRGVSFCGASVASFQLLFKNIARVAVVNSISFFLLLLVKTTITLAVGGAVFVLLSNGSISDDLALLGAQPVTSPMAPVLVACVLAWLVASAFANVYDAAIDTILLCFCEDTALNGDGASEFMSDELRRIMGDSGGKRKIVQVTPAAGANAKTGDVKATPSGGGATNRVHVEADEI